MTFICQRSLSFKHFGLFQRIFHFIDLIVVYKMTRLMINVIAKKNLDNLKVHGQSVRLKAKICHQSGNTSILENCFYKSIIFNKFWRQNPHKNKIDEFLMFSIILIKIFFNKKCKWSNQISRTPNNMQSIINQSCILCVNILFTINQSIIRLL